MIAVVDIFIRDGASNIVLERKAWPTASQTTEKYDLNKELRWKHEKLEVVLC